MKTQSVSDRLADEAAKTLTRLLSDGSSVEVRSGDQSGADFIIAAVGLRFLLQMRKVASAATIALAAKQLLERAHQEGHKTVPVLAVPFMGEVGRKICADAGVSWLDLSGNARIIAPGVRIIIDGRENRFLTAGRPSNLFAPKSSRIIRWLLMHPETPFTQREIARQTEMDEGFVSRIVSRLEEERYVFRIGAAVRVQEPALVLDSWRDAYQFSRHTIRRGHVAARSGDALLRFVNDVLTEKGEHYAATGLAAAWAFTRFAAFRVTTVYLPHDPTQELLDKLGFRDDPRGANLWLVVPNDAGVFHGAMERNGIRCVHPVQAYLDLKEQPERASEAATRLREEWLNWKNNA